MMNEARKSVGMGTRYEILRRDKFRCRYCGVPATEAEIHIDHVVPLALGGTNARWNLTSACLECNMGKGNGMPLIETIVSVRRAEAEYQGSRGRPVQPCDTCGMPQELDRCEICDGNYMFAYRSGFYDAESTLREIHDLPLPLDGPY